MTTTQMLYLIVFVAIGIVLIFVSKKIRKKENRTVNPVKEALLNELSPIVIDRDTFNHLLRRGRGG